MDVDVLRKQLADELQAQFESRLREVKRQKAQAEEELESVSERWRTERRRLNSEIDRLETALAEAKSPARNKGSAEGKPAGISPEEFKKAQRAADEKLKKTIAEWEAERERLTTENSRLERAVAEAIERSSNPIRSTQAIREQFEGKLEEAAKRRLEIEQELLRAKSSWDEDKKKLTSEIIKLRRLAPSKAYEVKEKIERMHGRAESMEEARIHELEGQLVAARADAGKYHEVSVKAQQDLAAANKEIQRLQEARSETPKESNASVVEHLKKEYDGKIQNLLQEKTREQIRFGQLESSLAETRAEIQKYQETADHAQEELSKATQEVESLQQTLAESRERVTTETVDQIRQEYEARIQDLIQEKSNERDQLVQLEEVLAETRAEVGKYQDSASQAQENLSRTAKEVESLQRTLAETVQAKSDEQSRLTQLETELAAARAELQSSRESAVQAQEHLAGTTREIELLQRTLSENNSQVSTEVVDQLRQQYDSRMQDVIQQKTQLAQDLESATATLATERSRFSAEVSKGTPDRTFDDKDLESEVKRIEEMIQAIATLIDDPGTDLTTVIRKNVEKAELNAYLRGILFSLGRASAL